MNVTDDYTWTNETYYFTTEGLRVWNTTFHWNVSFKNSSDWFVNSWHWNMSFRNTSVNVTLFHWNVIETLL